MKIKPGSKVICRLFNKPEGKFYGDLFEGEIVGIRMDDNNNKIYTVNREYGVIDLKRKEIKKVLSYPSEWTLELKTNKYYYWKHKEGYYNCTEDEKPPKVKSGYWEIAALRKLKNDLY
jgi:hypothetical protein